MYSIASLNRLIRHPILLGSLLLSPQGFALDINVPLTTQELNNKIQETIDNIKSIESKIEYDRIVNKTVPGSVSIAPNEKIKITFDYMEPYNAGTNYVVFANTDFKAVTIHNKADLSSRTEVITTKWHKPTELIYIENEGKITGLGTWHTESAISMLSAKTRYLHNKGIISGVISPIYAFATVIDNEGTIKTLS